MNWLQWINFVVTIISAVLPLLKQIEETIGGGNGPIKKQIAMNSIESYALASGASDKQVKDILAISSPLIDRQIESINSANIELKAD